MGRSGDLHTLLTLMFPKNLRNTPFKPLSTPTLQVHNVLERERSLRVDNINKISGWVSKIPGRIGPKIAYNFGEGETLGDPWKGHQF